MGYDIAEHNVNQDYMEILQDVDQVLDSLSFILAMKGITSPCFFLSPPVDYIDTTLASLRVALKKPDPKKPAQKKNKKTHKKTF